MADPDAENQLLDGIIGKYGEGSDSDDLGNADEEALLEGYDDNDSGEVKNYDPEELEDVLDLEAQDVELEEDEVDRSSHKINSGTVSSTTQFEAISYKTLGEEKQRSTDKFKNERQIPSSMSNNRIPDSLDVVNVKNTFHIANQTARGQARRRKNFVNRNNYNQHRLDTNKTVLINPHFKGQVHINSDARLAWDARHRINQNKNQIGKAALFPQNTRNEPANVQPWISNPPQNMPHSQQPPSPAYPPVFQPTPPQPTWNPAPSPSWSPPNPLNQVPPQQHVFMQPLPPPPMVYNNPSFNQPGPMFSPPPVYQQNQVLPQLQSVFQNPQFGPPPNQFGPPPNQFGPPPNQFGPPPNQFGPTPDPLFNSGYLPTHPSSIGAPVHNNNYNYPSPLVDSQFNSPVNRFMDNRPVNQGNLRYISHANSNCKPQFNKKIIHKRKADVPDRKKKRNLTSGNLHEVATVETPDTTVKEEKLQEDEDDETREYRKRIEEQKKLREKFLEQKELRRQQKLLLDVTSTDAQLLPKSQGQQRSRSAFQRNLQIVKINQPASAATVLAETASGNNAPITTFGNKQLHNRNTKPVNMENETTIDKQHLASFLSNRKILAKDQSLIDTSIVVVSNLAAGTTDVKLHKLCQGIGEIKTLQMSPKERQATIQFNSVASAHAFFKKYQRLMLDLSMIQVSLKPM